MWKKILLVLGIIVLAGVVYFYIKMRSLKNDITALTVSEVPLSEVSDGTWEGTCDLKIVSARVAVTVVGGAITEIKILEHRHGPDPKYSGAGVANKIIAEQKILVDAVSGATGSSKVVKKAVEIALTQGLKK